ncbi:alpha/beta hydrolase [Methyloceanibacter marginalis]|uniref:Alpha/beta hydrolase n=1 Tax=Methyloceanibacter marginalis TaxID=1774971 RepID=A0A1E3W9Q2_9HYPH|nr:alpha/beta hydrolase [Methyloceanibacter marginalis]ODS02470.1 alpha/beta hydrolase [Methyloceanibacter marginalis]
MRRLITLLGLFSVLAFTGLSARAAPLPDGAESKFAQVNGIRMHYVQMGEGPLLVLLHGWPQTWYEWADVMPSLAEHFTVVAPDLRGVGKTERTEKGYDKQTLSQDVAALIEHLNGDEPAVVVGHDMGGKAAFVLGLTQPERVKKLVLIDCMPPGTENMDVARGGLWHYGFHIAPDFPEMLTEGREREYLTAMMKLLSGGKEVMTDEAIDEYVEAYASPGGMTAGFNYYRALLEDADFVTSLSGKRLTMPVLTIGGEHAVAGHLYKALEGRSDDITNKIAQGSGHYVPEEMPEFTVEQIVDFAAAP